MDADEEAVVLEERVILTESETETEPGLPQNDSSGDDSSVDLIDTEETFFETAEEETELSTAADADSVTMITDISTEAASEDAEMLIEEISEEESISGENAFADPQNTDLAEGEVLTGSFGDDLTYTLDSSTGVLSFTGNGEIPRLYTTANANGVTLSDYIEVITSVVVGDGITSIGDHAFHGFENIAGISLPESITEIGEYAFMHDYALEEIDIPDGVTVIDEYTFGECTAFPEIIRPARL